MFKRRKKKKMFRRITALGCALSVSITGMPFNGLTAKAATGDPYKEEINVMIDKGGYKTELFGVGTDTWGEKWTDRSETLPPATTYLTDNYRETVGTVPTSDWASSVVFDQYSESLYAHPLAYRAASNGMQMASPAVTDSTSYVDGEPLVESLLDDTTIELVVGGNGFTAKDARVDKTTDWTYDILMENSAGTSSMMAILAKGTPYAYYTFDNLSPTISLGAGATDLTIYKNSTSSNILGISLKNKKDNKTHYYGVYAPAGTTWTNAGGKLTANLPSGADYLSIAILPDNTDAVFQLYEKYAFNFITDTKVEWEYHENASKVYTRYNVITKNMVTGAEGGDTILALYPHQWRYLMDGTLSGYTYDTIRGTMKTLVGSSYVTEMQYNGILSTLPVTTDETYVGQIKDQLGYLWDYRKNKDDPKWICSLEGQYGGYDTYWIGKNLNTLSEAIFLAGQFEDADMTAIKDDMVNGVAEYLQFWFDPYTLYESGDFVDDYFYYHKDYGTLIGYPASYSSDKEVNDHHFHYGYWIKAAAAVAKNNPTWAQEWGGMVYEMISDIANGNRDGSSYNEESPAKYPFLRNFDIYEGHSWASGVANYEYDADGNMIDTKGGLSGGNNQESSSESVNAWASLILWGETVGDKTIRDLGIYLYTTEIAAVEDYYYDVHNEIFTDAYEDKDNYNIQTVTRLFGGRYDHTAWWTENSIEVTTITMLPLSASTLYMGKYKDKVKEVVDSISETSKQWTHFVATKDQSCANFGKTDMLTDPETNQDVLAMYYAYYDADAAFEMWDKTDSGKVENGESRAHTFAYITSLMEYGTQNFNITGSSPFSLVLEKDGVKTYIAENCTDTDQRVYFSDGTYIDVPANSSYEGPKMGDGENPNVDDSEILGPQKKFNLEVYCEKFDGSGYEMTSRVVRAKTEENTYTYQPETIMGFTYDASNSNNVLTVDVTEGTVETVKVYYKRNTYSVSYETNGGTVSGTNPSTYRYGSSIELKNPVKEGYIFLGWYQEEDFSGAAITAISPNTAGNLQLYAKYRKEGAATGVSLDQTEVKSKSNQSFTLHATVEPDDAKNTKVTWESSSPSVATVSESGVVSTLTEGTTTITVTTDDGGFTAQCVVTVDDYEYVRGDKGVELDESGNLVIYAATTLGTVSVAFYKVYDTKTEAEAAVLGNLSGYNMTQGSNGYLEYSVTKPDDTKYLAYAFNGGVQETPVVIAVKDIPVVGSGSSEPEVVSYKIEHYQQNTSKSSYVLKDTETLTALVGESVTATEKTYTGFTQNASVSGTVASGTVVSDGSLVLKLYYDRNSYSYTYKYNDGVTADESLSYVYGVGVDTLKTPVRSGYVFQGWYTDETTNNKIVEIATDQIGDVVLYAKWIASDGTEIIDAAIPVIAVQPVSKTGEYLSVITLTVSANVVDGGVLSYQWYKNTSNSNVGGTAIAGATGISYQVPANVIGTSYYYCVITNTNNRVTGNKISTATSAVSKVDITKVQNPLLQADSTIHKVFSTKRFVLQTGAQGNLTFVSAKETVATVGASTGSVKMKRPGKTVITVVASGNAYYNAAIKEITLIVKPKKVTLSSAKSPEKAITVVKWKRDKKATGYEVLYATNKKFKSAKKVKVKKNTITSVKLKKMKAGKKYYIRVRAYKKSGETIYGAWSKTKTVRVRN